MTILSNEVTAEQLKQRVKTALQLYFDTGDVNAGYNILRYVERGLVKIKTSVDPNVFLEQYPQHSGYTLLRLARSGDLYLK